MAADGGVECRWPSFSRDFGKKIFLYTQNYVLRISFPQLVMLIHFHLPLMMLSPPSSHLCIATTVTLCLITAWSSPSTDFRCTTTPNHSSVTSAKKPSLPSLLSLDTSSHVKILLWCFVQFVTEDFTGKTISMII